MKTLLISIIFVCLSVQFAGGQNLVLNPGFEEYSTCPENPVFSSTPLDDFNNSLVNWVAYYATPDYYNLCGFHGNPESYPHSGNGFVNIATFKLFLPNQSYREYIHGTLSEPLQADSIYYVEFYVRPSKKPEANKISYIANYSLHFSTAPIDTVPTTDWVLNLEPHITHTGGPVLDTGWTKVSGCYQALGGEQYITIGNFLPDSLTTSYTPSGSSGDGNASLIDDVAVVPVGLAAFLPHTGKKICVGECIEINNPLAGQYEWVFPGGTPESSNLQSPMVCYDSAGVYDIQVIVEHCAGKDTFLLEDAVEVFEKPVNLTSNFQEFILSFGDTMTLVPCSASDTYQWLPNEALSCEDCPNPLLTALQTDTFTLLASNGGTCTDTCTYAVLVGSPPVADFSSSTGSICQNDCVSFSFTGSGQTDNYQWLFPGAQPASSSQPVPQGICYPTPGSYPVLLVVSNTFGADSLYLQNAINVYPEVEIISQDDQPLYLDFGDAIQLNACATGDTYSWSPPDGLSCTDCPNPTLTATLSADYTVEITNGGTCTAVCNYPVTVAFDDRIYVPNAFSPNGDGINDLFTAYGKYHHIESMKIFNRWGGIVWDVKGDLPWNGTFKGQPAQAGVYVYLIVYTDTRTGEVKTISGDVQLVR